MPLVHLITGVSAGFVFDFSCKGDGTTNGAGWAGVGMYIGTG